ncbi:MAG: acetyl-CoA carboxylase biotin carboxyl carrier protein subunit [Anaerolineae bacterium]
MSKVEVSLNNETAVLEVLRQGDHLRVLRDGQTTELHILQAGANAFVLEVERPDGSRQCIRAAAHVDGDTRQLWVNGRSFTYERLRQRPTGGSTHDGSLAASIPAVVSAILVAVGDSVQAGDKLILLESMKMVIPIQAPHDGVVTAVNCQPGESVSAGIPLIELEESSA